MCFYHLIIYETNANICSHSLATFHKKNAYLKVRALSKFQIGTLKLEK